MVVAQNPNLCAYAWMARTDMQEGQNMYLGKVGGKELPRLLTGADYKHFF